jgi:hypothetical protein
MATPTFSFTKGSTLTIEGVYTQSTPSAPANLDGVDLYCTLRDSRLYEYPLTVTKLNSTDFTLFYANTEGWHWGMGFMDLLFVKNGVAIYSETINVIILNNVTKNTYT